MKNVFCIISVLALVFSLLTACSAPQQDEETTLSTAFIPAETTEKQTEILGGLATSGNHGELKWELYHSGELVFSGEGEIEENSDKNGWAQYSPYIKTIIINEGITEIDENLFSGMKSLEKVSLPKSLKKVDERAFADCSLLKEIALPDGVTTVEDYAFENSGLEKIKIGAGVTEIGPLAFSGCKMKDINVSENNNAFSTDKYGVLFTKDKTKLVWYSLGFLMNSYNVPESVTVIGNNAFGNEYLSSVVLHEGLAEIGKNAFADCISLKSIEIPSTVTEIGSGAFSGCRSLKEFTFPAGLTHIRQKVLYGCDSLENINVPISVVSIDEEAFGTQANFEINYDGSKEGWEKIYIAPNNVAITHAGKNYGL